MKKALKIVLILICAVVLFTFAEMVYYKTVSDPSKDSLDDFYWSQPLSTPLTKVQVREDIDYVMDKLLNKHPAFLDDSNEKVILTKERYEQVLSSLSDDMTVYDEYKALLYMLSPLHDGHTYVSHWDREPLRLDDETYIENYGYPVKINGEPSIDIAKRLLEYSSYEMEDYEIDNFFLKKMYYEHYLKMAGVDTSDGVDFSYLCDKEELVIHHSFSTLVKRTPKETVSRNWVDFEIDKANDLGIFTLSTCTYNDEYKETVKSFFTEVNNRNITNIVIDLRGNSGGAPKVAEYFLRYCGPDKYNSRYTNKRIGNKFSESKRKIVNNRRLQPFFSGNIYVITDRDTFSAATEFAMYIKDNGIGYIVGEASANIYDCYTEALYYNLPNSNINLSVSSEISYRIDSSKKGQPITPDYPCNPDDALETIKSLIK